MNGLTLSLTFLFAAASAFAANATPALSSPVPVSTDLTSEARAILQPAYPDFKALNDKPGDKLADLIARSNGGISLIAPLTTEPAPVLIVALPNGIVYCRFPSFMPKKDWETVAEQIRSAIDYWNVYGTIVDLRENGSNDYVDAAQAMAFFVPGDTNLDAYYPQTGDRMLQLPFGLPDRHLDGPLVVLVNDHTSGAAEVLAARLKADGALVVGEKTSGATNFFAERTLSNGQVLRFAIAPLDSQKGVTPTVPVVPDISLNIDGKAESAALSEIEDNHLSDVIQENADRHRMNEAALVAGRDPEWDDYLATLEERQGGHLLLALPPIHDVALVHAIDSVEAIRVTRNFASPPSPGGGSSPASASVQ